MPAPDALPGLLQSSVTSLALPSLVCGDRQARGQEPCGQAWLGMGISRACTDQPCPHRVQPLRVQDPRPAGADDEQQHELGLRLAPHKREEIALCPVRLRPACCSALERGTRHIPQPGPRGVTVQPGLAVPWMHHLEGAAERAGLLHWLVKAGYSNAFPKDYSSLKAVVSAQPGWPLVSPTQRISGKQGNGEHPALLLPQAACGSFQGTLLKPTNSLLLVSCHSCGRIWLDGR